MDAQPTPVAAPGADAGSVTLADRFRIYPGMPLPGLASPAVAAFAAVDSRDQGRRLAAMLPPRHLPFRDEPLGGLRRLERSSLICPVEWGIVKWPNDAGGCRPVIVLQAPAGERLMAPDATTVPPMSEDGLIRKVLRPLLAALKDLRDLHLVHGAIRPDNLFYRDGVAGEAMLGDGYTTPPGFTQPVAFLTIEDGMANPAGRGSDIAADFYALGVTLVTLLRGQRPGATLDDGALIAAKIEQGSFAALAEQLPLSVTMTEVLRGLLCDDQANRWTLDDLEMWFDGRRLTPRPPGLAQQASRPFVFKDVEYMTRPALAHAFARNWDPAILTIHNGTIDPWLRRSLGDDERADLIAADLAATGVEADKAAGDRLLARVLVALDPSAPLRLRGFACRIDSLGPVLADVFDRPELVQLFVEVIRSRLPQLWIQAQAAPLAEFVALRKTLGRLDFFIDRRGPGYGIERCLYELNRALPCRSPLVEADHVIALRDLLPALNRAAAGASAGSEPMDRHLAAFIAARAGWSIDRELAGLALADDLVQRRLSILKLLAIAQQGTPVDGVPELGAWVASLLDPIVDNFHYRPFKESLRKQLGPLARQGRFAEIAVLIDDPETLRRDQYGFDQAKRRYAAASRASAWLAEGGLRAPGQVLPTAQRAAAVTSTAIAGLFLAALALFFVV